VNADGEVTEQWLGPRGASFLLTGLPYLTEANLIALFDLTEKQCDDIYFSHDPLPVALNFDDTDTYESIIEREKFTLGYGGRIIRPLLTRDGIAYVDNAYFEPLSDVADMLELYERRAEGGGVYFAAKTGFLIVGMIMPRNIIELGFVEYLETLATMSREALRLKGE